MNLEEGEVFHSQCVLTLNLSHATFLLFILTFILSLSDTKQNTINILELKMFAGTLLKQEKEFGFLRWRLVSLHMAALIFLYYQKPIKN